MTELLKPEAVIEAEKELEAAQEAFADAEDKLDAEERQIAAERARLAQPWPPAERRRWRDQQLKRPRGRVTVAERRLDRAWIDTRAERAPLIAQVLDERIEALRPRIAELLRDEFAAIAGLRAMLDDAEGVHPGLRGFVKRLPGGRVINDIPMATPSGIADHVLAVLDGATSKGRARLVASTFSKATRKSREAAVEAATTYEELRAALRSDGAATDDRKVA